MQSTPRADQGEPRDISSSAGGRQRALDVLAMHDLARRPDSVAALLRWLSHRTRCWVGLLDTSGTVLAQSSPVDSDALSLVTQALQEMLGRGLPTFSVDDGSGSRAVLLTTDDPVGGRGLVLANFGPDRGAAPLLADAAVVLATCWSAEEARRVQSEVELAEARCREAVLHLLTSRNLPIARQLAAPLVPALPDPMQVYLIESAPERRREVAVRCAELTDGRAWTVRCPVYSRHVIVLAPASLADEHTTRPIEAVLAAEISDCVVGAGDVVGLIDTAVGYQQAFHALAVAQTLPERSARFSAALDLPTVIGPPGLTWATAFLAPLLSHVPARAGDPDAQQLTATARSWLSFSTGATRHLKIHRNTLTTRLRGLEQLLGLNLSRLGAQAALDLALRIMATPRPAPAGDAAHTDEDLTLDDLLCLPRTQQWARAMLDPIHESSQAEVLETTLRVWLDSDSRLSVTAEVLKLSVGGARKRVMRLEQVLERSLLQAPSARHDLWLAVRAIDLGSSHG